MAFDPKRPNTRGTAVRSQERNIRYATHLPVLEACVGALSASADRPICVVEQGQGLGSTPYFHALPHVCQFISFEREAEWLTCTVCAGQSAEHRVVHIDDRIVTDQVNIDIAEPSRSLALVDGFASQRLAVLDVWMRLEFAFIVEHDADTFESRDVEKRRALAREHGYLAFQYVDHNPETAIYVGPNGPALALTGSCVAL